MASNRMTRRLLLAAPFASRLIAADATSQVYELVTDAVSYLSADNAQAFLGCFDKGMPGYEKFAASVTGLVQQCEIQSSVEVLRNEGDDAARAVELDWLMQVKLRYQTEQIERRHEVVKCRAQKAGRKWKFVALSPQSLFAVMKV